MSNTPPDLPWADEPYKLITPPSLTQDTTEHSRIQCASLMALTHNILLRGLNAILLQAPHIQDSTSQEYNKQDVADLLFYTQAWVRVVYMHHDSEEKAMFPGIERETGVKGLFDEAEAEHGAMTPGLERLLKYAQTTVPEDYRWQGGNGMKDIIDSFAEVFTTHLYEEIDMFLGFGYLDSDALMKGFDIAKEEAKTRPGAMDVLFNVFPCVLGCSDKTAPGHAGFPALGVTLPYATNYVFSWKHSGAWRFNPCDFYGRPVPLHFIAEARKDEKL